MKLSKDHTLVNNDVDQTLEVMYRDSWMMLLVYMHQSNLQELTVKSSEVKALLDHGFDLQIKCTGNGQVTATVVNITKGN